MREGRFHKLGVLCQGFKEMRLVGAYVRCSTGLGCVKTRIIAWHCKVRICHSPPSAPLLLCFASRSSRTHDARTSGGPDHEGGGREAGGGAAVPRVRGSRRRIQERQVSTSSGRRHG